MVILRKKKSKYEVYQIQNFSEYMILISRLAKSSASKLISLKFTSIKRF